MEYLKSLGIIAIFSFGALACGQGENEKTLNASQNLPKKSLPSQNLSIYPGSFRPAAPFLNQLHVDETQGAEVSAPFSYYSSGNEYLNVRSIESTVKQNCIKQRAGQSQFKMLVYFGNTEIGVLDTSNPIKLSQRGDYQIRVSFTVQESCIFKGDYKFLIQSSPSI